MLEKFSFNNVDGSAIDIPDAESWRQLIKHVQDVYPDIYERHLGRFNIHDMVQFKSFEESEEYRKDYVDFVSKLKHPIILPDGSELLNPMKMEIPVGCTAPKSLHETLHTTLNIGRIQDEYEEAEEARYDAEREYAAFEEVGELAKNHPERFRALYSDSLYSDGIASLIAEHNAKIDSQSGTDVPISDGARPSEKVDSSGPPPEVS